MSARLAHFNKCREGCLTRLDSALGRIHDDDLVACQAKALIAIAMLWIIHDHAARSPKTRKKDLLLDEM